MSTDPREVAEGLSDLDLSKLDAKDCMEHRKLFEGLVKSPGWKAYEHLLDQLMNQRMGQSLGIVTSVDEAMLQNGTKGELAGIAICLQFPRVMMARFEERRLQLEGKPGEDPTALVDDEPAPDLR